MLGDRARRIMVVSDRLLHDRVGAAVQGAGLEADIQTTSSFLSAIGAASHEPPDTVIGPMSAMTGMVSATGKTLRKLAPHARLVVIAQPEERSLADTASNSGFDEVIYEPANATQLLVSLGFGHAISENAPSPASLPQTALPMPEEDAALGDSDLVAAIHREDGSLPTLAMRLLTQQCGIQGIALAESADQVQPGHSVVAVRTNGDLLGLLHAPAPATPGQLNPWAHWLAQWLLLDRKMGNLNKLAMTDELTGAWNRRYFRQYLERTLKTAGEKRQPVTLLLFDIDDFKSYNDRYGHPAGDEILRETARLIQSLVRDGDIVARIGGDEFAVVFFDQGEQRQIGSQHPDNVIGIARRFQKAICEHRYPKLGTDAVGQLTVSGGLAGFPWDGQDVDTLVAHADAMAIQSKRQGKNVICFGPGCAPVSNGDVAESE